MNEEPKIEVKIPPRKSKCDQHFGRLPAAYDLHECTGGGSCDGKCQPKSSKRVLKGKNDD